MTRLALFDLDNTLLTGDSDDEWFHFLAARGVIDRDAERAAHADLAHRYREGRAGTLEFCEFFLRFFVPHDHATLLAWREQYLRESILPRIPASARELLARHRSDDLGPASAPPLRDEPTAARPPSGTTEFSVGRL